jgi:predicted nucleic acid-binding protein
VIPDNLKNRIVTRLTDLNYSESINKEIRKVIIYLKNSKYNPALRKEFIAKTLHYDKIRGQNFEKTFPEILELFNG